MTLETRDGYEKLALERLAELARSTNERIALEAARTMLAHLRLTRVTEALEGERAEAGPVASSTSPPDADPDMEKAREHVLRAMDRCAGLLEHENPFVALRAAREILQHWRHLCRERFRWVAWSEVRERRDRKRRGVAARARVKNLGRELAGIRRDIDAQNGPYGPDERQSGLSELRQEGGIPPVCQGGQKVSFGDGDEGETFPAEESGLEPWEQEFEGAEEYRFGPPPPIDWGDDPDERAPP